MSIPDQQEAKAAVMWSRYGVNWDELDSPTRELLLPLRAPHPIRSVVPSIKGHGLRIEGGVGWCACGAYMGGLGNDAEFDMPSKERHELHRAVIRSRMAREAEPTLFDELDGSE